MANYLKTEGVLVGDSGVSTLVYSKTHDIVELYMNPWRQNGGEWMHTQLNIEIRVSKAFAGRALWKWKEGEGIRVQAKKPKPATYSKHVLVSKGQLPIQRIVLKDVPVAKKTEGPPATFKFPKLGKLKYDEGVEGYSKWRAVRGEKYELSLMPKNLKKLQEEMVSAEKHLFAIERKLAMIKAAATRKLLPLYNKKWREEAPVLSVAAFTKQLKPTSIFIDAKGRGSMILDCGELFGDHGIEITLGAGGKPGQIGLA